MNLLYIRFVSIHGIDKHYGILMIRKLFATCLSAVLVFSLSAAVAAEKEKNKTAVDISKIPPPSDQKDVSYVKDIKPIFDHSCIKCHGPEKQKGKLRLDTLPAALKGGEDGKVIQPGNSANSILVHNVAHVGDEDEYMPPPDNKDKIPPLTKEQIGLVRAWIDQGAK